MSGSNDMFELIITDNKVSDNQLHTALYLNACLGIVCFSAFCILQRTVAPDHYRFRQVSDSVTVKMRRLPTEGWHSLWQWLVYALTMKDGELLQSAGLDAVVHVKVLAIGVQLFAPIAVAGCLILIPIHAALRKNLTEVGVNRSQLMQLTIAALPSSSPVMWVHFVLVVLYNLYAMGLLWWHYSHFLMVRQHYLVKGDDPNYWITMTQSSEVLRTTKKVKRLIQEASKELKKQKKAHNKAAEPPAAGDVEAALTAVPPSPAPTGTSHVPETPGGLLARASFILRHPQQLVRRISNNDSRATTPATELDSAGSRRRQPSHPSSRANSTQLPDLGWLEAGLGGVPELEMAPPNRKARQAAALSSAAAGAAVTGAMSVPLLKAPVGGNSAQSATPAALTEAALRQKSRLELPVLQKHMRTITEDSLEYRLEQWSRPNSRGGAPAPSGSASNLGSTARLAQQSRGSPDPFSDRSASAAPSSPFARHSGVAQQIAGQGVGLVPVPVLAYIPEQGDSPVELTSETSDEKQQQQQQPAGSGVPGQGASPQRDSSGGAEFNPLHNNLEALVPLPVEEAAEEPQPGEGRQSQEELLLGPTATTSAAIEAAPGSLQTPLDSWSAAPSSLPHSRAEHARLRVQSSLSISSSMGLPVSPRAAAGQGPGSNRSSMNGLSGPAITTDGIHLLEHEGGAAAGAAIGAGTAAPVNKPSSEMGSRRGTKDSIPAAAALDGASAAAGYPSWGGTPLSVVTTAQLQRHTEEEEEDNASPAHRWWLKLPKHLQKDLLSRPGSDSGDKVAGQLLAKPSVRFRKTINTWDALYNQGMGAEVSVNAQHYAVLVTDVRQPYDITKDDSSQQDMMSRFSRTMAQIPAMFYSRRSFLCCGYPHSVVMGEQEDDLDSLSGLDWGINKRQLQGEQAGEQLQDIGERELRTAAQELELTVLKLAETAATERNIPLWSGLRKLQKAQTMLRQQEERQQALSREASHMHLASRVASRANVLGVAPTGLLSRSNSYGRNTDLRSELNAASSSSYLRPESSAVAGAYIGNPEFLTTAPRAPSAVWTGPRGLRASSDILAFTRDVAPPRPLSAMSGQSMIIHSSRDSRSSRDSWLTPPLLQGQSPAAAGAGGDLHEQYNPLYERARAYGPRTSMTDVNPVYGVGAAGAASSSSFEPGGSMGPRQQRRSSLTVSWGPSDGSGGGVYVDGQPPESPRRHGGDESARASWELSSLGPLSPRSASAEQHNSLRMRHPWHAASPLGDASLERRSPRVASSEQGPSSGGRTLSSTSRLQQPSPFAAGITPRQRAAQLLSSKPTLLPPEVHGAMHRRSLEGGSPATAVSEQGVTLDGLLAHAGDSASSVGKVPTATPSPRNLHHQQQLLRTAAASVTSRWLATTASFGGSGGAAATTPGTDLEAIANAALRYPSLPPLLEAGVVVRVQENKRKWQKAEQQQQERDQGRNKGRTSVLPSRRVLQGLPFENDKMLGEIIKEACRRSGLHGWPLLRWTVKTGIAMRLVEVEQYSGIVASTFRRLFPQEFDRAVPVVCHYKVDNLLNKWEVLNAQLERAVLTRQRTGEEPMKRSYCCCGEETSVIANLNLRISDVERQVEQARKEAWSSGHTPSWFVLFNSQQAASMAASSQIYAEDDRTFEVHPAPGPEEVNWQHLWLSRMQRHLRGIIVWPFLLVVVLFPITLFTSAAGRIEYLFCPSATNSSQWNLEWEWYCAGHKHGDVVANFVRSFLTGWVPAFLLNLYLVMALPRLVYVLVQTEGNCLSLSALERRISGVFFHWDVFNVFLQGAVGSTFFQQMWRIFSNPSELPQILGAAIPDSSNFFMQFIAMRALFLVWLRLCIPHGGVWQSWLFRLLCPAAFCSMCNTDRDKSLAYGPRTPRYGFEVGHILLMYLISMAYCVVAPLIVPFSVVWFMFAWVAWRHNLSYVYQRKYESGGMMWTFIFNRICMCLVIMQLFTFCVLLVKQAYVQATLIVVFMPVLTMKFNRLAEQRFGSGINIVPLSLAQRAPRAAVPSTIYIPPPLQGQSWGWYPEWNKMWDGWGMPAYGL